MKYTYIPTGIIRDFMSFGIDFDRKRYIVGIVGGEPVAIHSSGQTVFSFPHLESITLGAGEEVDEVAGRAKA
jgi:hypothetical protein